MSNSLSPELLAEIFAQESGDPFLLLVEISHPDFLTTQRFVNNNVDIVSRGNTYSAFPMKVKLPVDDGDGGKEVVLEMDNVGRVLIDEIRSIVTPMAVKLEMILASNPDQVQLSLEELKIRNIAYDKSKITAKLTLDDFLNTAMTSEAYTPLLYPGLY